MTDEKLQAIYRDAHVVKQKLGVSMDVAILIMILEKLTNGNN